MTRVRVLSARRGRGADPRRSHRHRQLVERARLPRRGAGRDRRALRRLRPPAQPDHDPPDRRRRHVRHQGHRPHRPGGPARQGAGRLLPERPVLDAVAGDLGDDHPRPRSRPTTCRRASCSTCTREAAAKRPGVLTKVGLDTFVDPTRQGCAMNAKGAAEPIVRKVEFDGDDWLFFPTIVPDVAIIRATTADERGNLTYEHEGAYLGPLDQALAARNNGGHRHRPGQAAGQGRHAQAVRGPRAGRAGRRDRGGAGPDADDADRLRSGDQRRVCPRRGQLPAARPGASTR